MLNNKKITFKASGQNQYIVLLNGVVIGIVGKYETARRSYWHFEKNENCPKPDKGVEKSSDNTRFGAVWNEIGDLMF